MNTSPAMADRDPDRNAGGILAHAPDAARYDRQTYEPRESTGLIGSFIPTGARVLDIGCGTGSVSRLIRDHRHATVVGIEPNAERAALCRARGIEVHAGYLTPELLATLGMFEAIVFADVLEHVANPAALLHLVRPALKANGIVVASMPNVAHWTVRARLLLGRFNYSESGIMDATHLRWFTTKTVRELFVRSGFHVTTLEGSAGLWMKEYQWLPSPLRRRLIPRLARAWPALFACQLVVRAESAAAEALNP
jgi:methionine biosynthesis protein MetW